MKKNVVQIIFVSDAKVLLGFRQNTDALDQLWGFPSGRIEFGEVPLEAAKREALEEVSVEIKELIPLCELFDTERSLLHYFYICENWFGDIKNAEPELCREVRWFDIKSLPENCTPITYSILEKLDSYLKATQLRN